MKRDLILALEKPIAHTPGNCRQLLHAHRTYNARVLVGFVMRSTPFYLQAKHWIKNGAIGEVVSIQADELPEVFVTATMFRSDWRRFKHLSGGSLLEKCCHDIDMMTWLSGGAPIRISSMAGVKTLGPNPSLPTRCSDCRITAECPYYLPPEAYDVPGLANRGDDGILYKFVPDNTSCIYNNGHDTYDHQTVQLEYDNGVLATLTLDFSCLGSATGRHLKVVGTDGVIFGKLQDREIRLQNKHSDHIETVKLHDDGSGHIGAERQHSQSFVKMFTEPDYEPLATLEAGFLSAMLCFAADQSVGEAKHIDISHLMDEIQPANLPDPAP